MKVFDEYWVPATALEALELLARYQGAARVIAGGTDLLVDMQGEFYDGQRPHVRALVDVTRLPEAQTLRLDQDWLVIGCGVTHTQLVESPLVQARAQALAEACAVVGGPQVRNVATLVGNVAHALPAADGTLALLVLDAEAQVATRVADAKVREPILEWRPLASLFRGPGISAVDSTREIITALRIRPTGLSSASAFSRVMRPQGVALPILGMAARVQMDRGVIADVAVSAGPVAPIPFRARGVEAFLRGRAPDPELLQRAGEILLEETGPRTSVHRATREYRQELLPGLFRLTLQRAIARAEGLEAVGGRVN